MCLSVIKGKDHLSIQFTSGDYFSMKWDKAWESFAISFSSFNVGSWNGEPVMLGQARQVEECTETGCMQVMVSDNSVSIHDKVRLLSEIMFGLTGRGSRSVSFFPSFSLNFCVVLGSVTSQPCWLQNCQPERNFGNWD